MKKSKLWLPVLTIAALTVATGAVFADTTSSSTTSGTQQTQSAQHTGKHFQHQGGFGVFGQDQQALLTLLKIDAPTLKQDLQAGKSLADIAQAQGVTEQQVIDLLVNSQSSAIDKAVTAGKMTQAQATKFKANLSTRVKQQVESKHTGAFGKQGPRGGFGFGFQKQDLTSLATLLKLDTATLQKDLQSGQSLADVAQAQGVTEQQVIDLLVNSQSANLDKAVTAGKMTQAQATQFKANLSTRVKQQVESKHTGGQHGPRRGGFGFGFQKQDLTSLATLLKLDTATLQKDLQSGQSLADIAQAQGVTEQQVIDLLVNSQSANLDKAVTAGKMTQAQATKMESNLPTFIKKMVEAKHTAGQHQGNWNHTNGTGNTQPQNQVKQ